MSLVISCPDSEMLIDTLCTHLSFQILEWWSVLQSQFFATSKSVMSVSSAFDIRMVVMTTKLFTKLKHEGIISFHPFGLLDLL